MECVPLETVSTEAGVKHFIAVGTSIIRGEDLAVKGAVSIGADSSHERNSFLLSDIHL